MQNMLKSLVTNSNRRIFTCLFVPYRLCQPYSNSLLRDSASVTGYPGSAQVTDHFHTTSACQENGAKDLNYKEYLNHFLSYSKQEDTNITELYSKQEDTNIPELNFLSSSNEDIYIHKPEPDARFGFPTPDTPMMRVGDELYKDIHILYIASRKNNVIMTLTTGSGKTLTTITAGGQGLKNKKESTNAAAQLVTFAILKKAEELNIKNIRVCLKGYGNAREAGLKTLSVSGLNVVSITDNTQLPYSGNKPKSVRH